MIKSLNEYEKFKVIRPLFGDYKYDKYDMPIIKKNNMNSIDWNSVCMRSVQSLSVKKNNSNIVAHMFLDDKKLLRYWNNPLKGIPLFQTCLAVGTPDYSLNMMMNINEIRHNIYENRWLGATWQSYGCTVFPTIGWIDEDSYDLCFSGVEKGSIVLVSTLGCLGNSTVFLKGFDAMKKAINPQLIIVYGEMIKGMTGRFINFTYDECFFKKNIQLSLPIMPQIFTLKEMI